MGGIDVPARFKDSQGRVVVEQGALQFDTAGTAGQVLTVDAGAKSASFKPAGGGSQPLSLTFPAPIDYLGTIVGVLVAGTPGAKDDANGFLWVGQDTPDGLGVVVLGNAVDGSGNLIGGTVFVSTGDILNTMTTVGNGVARQLEFTGGATVDGTLYVSGGLTVSDGIGAGYVLNAYGSGGLGWYIDEVGHEAIGALSAPADGDVPTATKVKWFDATSGKPVERFKEQDEDGLAVIPGVALGSTGNQDTVGAAGTAADLPAKPSHYMKVRDINGDLFVIPMYAAS